MTFILISSDNILDANKAFVSLSLFNIMSNILLQLSVNYFLTIISTFLGLPLGFIPVLLSTGALVLKFAFNLMLNIESIV